MTPTEAVKLTRLVKAICPQQQFDEYTADAWGDLLADMRLDDCTEAVKRLGQQQPFIAPAEIRAAVRKIRTDRLERTPLPAPDPDMTPVQTIQWLRNTRRAIADGTYVAPETPELAPRPVAELTEGAFQRVEDA